MPLLGLLGGAIPWKLIGGIGAVLAVVMSLSYCSAQIKKVGKLEGQLDSAIEIANSNSAQLKLERSRAEALQKAITEYGKLRLDVKKKADSNRTRIVNAPKEDDGPLAPVLRRELDSLQP